MRCASDTLLFHDHYGPSGFGIYTRNLPPETKRVYALYARHGHNSDKNVSGNEAWRMRRGQGRNLEKDRHCPTPFRHAVLMCTVHVYRSQHRVLVYNNHHAN